MVNEGRPFRETVALTKRLIENTSTLQYCTVHHLKSSTLSRVQEKQRVRELCMETSAKQDSTHLTLVENATRG